MRRPASLIVPLGSFNKSAAVTVTSLPQPMNLVGRRHAIVESFLCYGYQPGVCNPGAVVPVTDFTIFIFAHPVQGDGIGLGIVLDGYLGGHAAHGMGPSFVAALDDPQGVGTHTVPGHGDLGPVGKHITRNVLESFDKN